MRKSNLTKILIAILAFSLLLGAIVGITTTAADEGDVYLENADVERNVQYESQTYLLYRIAKSAIKEEDKATLCMQIASTDGSIVGKITPKEDGDYYVFVTQGVPAKEINTKEVVTVMSGSKAISPAITWSVEEYLYARLYADKYADVTEGGKAEENGNDDGLDFERRQLYYDLLKYGVEAQKLLAPDAEDKIGDSAFVFADDAIATYGRFDEPTKITLRYDNSKTPTGEIFLGWECNMYDAYGDLVETVYVADSSVLTAEGYIKTTPVYSSDFGYVPTYMTFDGVESRPSNIYINSKTADNYVESYADGKFSLTKNVIGKDTISTLFISPNQKLNDAKVVIFEADFSVNITEGSEIYFTIYTSASGGDKVYWSHWNKSGDYIKINLEYSKTTEGGQVSISRGVVTPMKWDGTSYKLRIVYCEREWGEDYLEFYADGQLFHTSSNFYATKYNDPQTPAKATELGSVSFNLSEQTAGTLTFDNLAMTQCNLPEFEKLGVDETIVDFDASSADVKRNTSVTEDKYYTNAIDEKTGNGYILLTKHATGSGMSIDIPVTHSEEGANYAVLSFDYYMEDTVTRLDNQIMLGHTNYSSIANGSTPILPSLPQSGSALTSHKGKWIHVEITYEVKDHADDGTVNKIESTVSATNGVSVGYSANTDVTTGVYRQPNKSDGTLGTLFKIFGAENGIDVPEVEELTSFRINLNNSAFGDVRFDNLSFKLLNKVSE